MGANENAFSDERLTRLRNACYPDGPIAPESQAALVALSIRRAELSRSAGDKAQELREVKAKLRAMLERIEADRAG